jgi:hypothetical protein
MAVAALLRELRRAEAHDALDALARRAAHEVKLDNPLTVAALTWQLRGAGADDAITTLVGRAANAGMFRLFLDVRTGEPTSYQSGREPDGTPSRSWRWQEPGESGP